MWYQFSVRFPGMHLWHGDYGPFIPYAQTEFCRRLIVVPLCTFHRMSELIGDPKGQLIFLFNTTRCGSTLLNQVLICSKLRVYIPGGPKKRPELCVTITARILIGATFVDQYVLLLAYYKFKSARKVPSVSRQWFRLHARQRSITPRQSNSKFSSRQHARFH